jgi:hypothetical protein
MRCVCATFTTVGLLCIVATASGQSKPDFSGRWVVVSPPDVAGQERDVRHDATTLSTSHPSEGGGHGAVYKLDGSESRNALASHGNEIVSISTASWTRDRLTVRTTTTQPDGRRSDQTQVWSLDAEGRLVIEVTETWRNSSMKTKLVHSKR